MLALFSGLVYTRATPTEPAIQVLGIYPSGTIALRIDEAWGMYLLFVVGLIMTSTEHMLQMKFMKMKPPLFKSVESEDACEFSVDYNELLLKLGICINTKLSL